MLNEFFTLIVYYFLIFFSIIGFGFLFVYIVKKNNEVINIGYIGLSGLFFILIYSYISNFFFSHNIIHNLLFLIIGLFFFFYFKKQKFLKIQKKIYFSLLVFFILSISMFIYKNHDDFAYYHFPYTYYLTQNSFHIGVGQFNHGFRTPSSIFYINSMFYLPFGKYYLFNFAQIYILGFSNIYLLTKIYDNLLISRNIHQIGEVKFINYLCLLSFIFINIFFYRISEHGTDRSAQILILLFFITILENLNYKKKNNFDVFFIYILIGFIISLKSFYILYLILFIPIIYNMYENNKKILPNLKLFIFNKKFIFLSLVIFFTLFTYLINTGCLIYPLSFSCFENLSWSIPKINVEKMHNWYELWSKAGATPNYRVENPGIYIQSINWLNNWIENYFFNKFSDFFLGLVALSLIFVAFFINFNFKKIKIKINNYVFLIYFILIILILEWFYNHPALRYGGYSLIALLIFIPLSIYMASFKIKKKKLVNSSIILILITAIVFLGRNTNRIINEVEKYKYKPFTGSFYKVDQNHFRIQNKLDLNIEEFKICERTKKICENYEKKINFKFRKYIFLINK